MKALTLVLCILALLGSGASGFFWWQIGNTKKDLQTQLASEQARLATVQGNLSSTTAALEKKTSENLELDASLSDTKRNLTAAEARNVQTSRELDATKKAVATKEENERKLNVELDNLRRDLVQTRLAAQVGSPEEIEKYKQTIASLETRLAELQATPAAGGTGVPAGTPGGPAAPGQAALSERTAAARVAKVGTKNAFVVLDLGVADGIVVGNKFHITRAGDTIAESVISEVKDTYAIAQIAPTSIKTSLKSGDIATYQN
jgi:ribosomal protein L29